MPTRIPSIKAERYPSDAELLPPPSGGRHSAQGVGEGWTLPPSYVPPPDCATTANVSTRESDSESKSLFINGSPLIEVIDRGGIASARTEHSTTTDPLFIRWQSYLDRGDYHSAADLCRERKMLASTPESCVRWAKDGAIVDAMQGRFREAFEQLSAVHFVAQSLRGRPRAKYEDALGLVLVERNRTSLALSHFGIAIREHRQAGYLRGVAAVRHNAARAYAARGEMQKFLRYINRALAWARGANDYRLEMEICQSLVEFKGEAL